MVDFNLLLEKEDELCANADCAHRRGDHERKWTEAEDGKPVVTLARCWQADCLCNRFEEKEMSNALKLIETKADRSIAPKAQEALELAKAIIIDDDETYELVAKWITTELQPLRKEINETFDPGINDQRKALETMRASKNRYAKPYEQAVEIAKGKMAGWIELKERQKIEEERRLREEAQWQAEQERKLKVEKLAKDGKPEEAKQLAQLPVTPPPVVLGAAVPKVDGISRRKLYKFRITDAALLPREYLQPDEERIRRVVEALGEDAKIPGVEVYRETNIAAGAR